MKKCFALWLSILLMFGLMAPRVTAAAPPDTERSGSLTVSLIYQNTPMAGGQLTLFRVARLHVESQEDYGFRLAEEFAGSGVELTDLSGPETAAALAEYAAAKELVGVTRESGEDGKITFAELELGLYLLIQETGLPGEAVHNPFLVSIPGQVDGEYVYDVDASPKLSVVPEETWPYEPTVPDMPPKPSEPELPNTGLTQWPIPVMLVSGLVLVVVGWTLCVAGRKRSDET